MYLEEPPSGYTYVVAGGYTHGLSINPSAHFNGDGSYRNRWKATIEFYPSTRPVPNSNPDDAHVGCFLRVNPNRTWGGEPNQTRFGCWINGKTSNPRAALQFTADQVGDPSSRAHKTYSFNLSEDPWANPTSLYRIEIIEEEKLDSGSWKLQWGGEVWNVNTNTKIGEKEWITEDNLSGYSIAVPELSGSRYAMGLGPSQGSNAAGSVVVDSASTYYWEF